MAYKIPSNQRDVLQPLHYNGLPAVFNMKDPSITCVPSPLPRCESNGFRNFPFQNLRTIGNELGRYPCFITSQPYVNDAKAIHGSNPLPIRVSGTASNMGQNANLWHQFPSEDKRIQDFPLPTNQNLTNGSNLTQHSQFLQIQHSSNEIQLTESFHDVKTQYDSNIPQQSNFLEQVNSIRIDTNQNSNVFIQNTFRKISNVPPIKDSTSLVLPPIDPARDYSLPYRKFPKESIMSSGVQSIIQNPPKDGLNIIQNPHFPCYQTYVNHSPYPIPHVTKIRDVSKAYHMSGSNVNLLPHYSENVQICLVGPPGCGKADLIRTFARNDNISVPTGKPLNKAFQQGMCRFGTDLRIDIWQAEDLNLAAKDLTNLCKSSKSVIVLVYSVKQQTSWPTIIKWVKLLKNYFKFKVPIILVENNTDAESEIDSKEFTGAQVLKKYELAEFYEYSTKYMNTVERVFLIAAHKALYQKTQQ